jgi:hypothetical protein
MGNALVEDPRLSNSTTPRPLLQPPLFLCRNRKLVTVVQFHVALGSPPREVMVNGATYRGHLAGLDIPSKNREKYNTGGRGQLKVCSLWTLI